MAHGSMALGDGPVEKAGARRASPRRLILLATAIVLLVVGGSAYFLVHASRTDDLAAQIDAQVDTLGIQPAALDPTSDRALHVRNSIVAEDFATANQIVANVFASSGVQNWRFYPYEDFIADVFGEPAPEFEKHLDVWIAQDKANAAPLLLRAQYYFNTGWAVRDHGFSTAISSDRMASFAGDMKKAFADVNAAMKLDPSNPYNYYLRLRILQGGGWSPAFADAFADGIAKFPAYYPLYELMLETLQPRWGGSVGAMNAFVDKYAGAAPQFSPLRMLYLSLYRHLLSTASVNCGRSGGNNDRLTACVDAFMNKASSPGLEQNVLDALHLYDHTDKYQFGLVIRGIISDMLGTSGGDTFAGEVLQLAASSMHSDTQLKENDPGHNDYVADELVAESWADKGFYDNEVTKYKEALADAQRASFPNKAEKNLARALIYEWLSDAASQQDQYADEIAFEKAAVLLGNPWDEHYICYGYYELKRYDQATRAFHVWTEAYPALAM